MGLHLLMCTDTYYHDTVLYKIINIYIYIFGNKCSGSWIARDMQLFVLIQKRPFIYSFNYCNYCVKIKKI